VKRMWILSPRQYQGISCTYKDAEMVASCLKCYVKFGRTRFEHQTSCTWDSSPLGYHKRSWCARSKLLWAFL